MRKFQSRYEERLYKNAPEGTQYETEVWEYETVPYNAHCLDCGGKKVVEKRKYTPDFILPNGVVVEAKGLFTSKMRTKIKDVIKSNPHRDLRIIFQQDNWLTKAKKKRYTEWCTQQGIKSAVHFSEIPKEWSE